MSSLLRYLREHKLAWLVPLVVVLALLAALAWRVAGTPDSPFIYDW